MPMNRIMPKKNLGTLTWRLLQLHIGRFRIPPPLLLIINYSSRQIILFKGGCATFYFNAGTLPKKSYSTEIWHNSCFYDVQQGTRTKLPPSADESFFWLFLAELDILKSFEKKLFFSKKILFWHLTLSNIVPLKYQLQK